VHPELLQRIVEELRTNLTGRYLGKIFQLSPVSFALDFGLRGEFLFMSVDPANPRIYLIRRRARDLEKESVALNSFAQTLRSRFTGESLIAIEKDSSDRIVRLAFPSGKLIVQLTGRTADLFVIDDADKIESVLRTRIEGIYAPPPQNIPEIPVPTDLPLATSSASAGADAYYSSLERAKEFAARANAARSRLLKSIRQKQKLKVNLQNDLAHHGDPAKHKRIGDLLLANVSTAKRHGNKVTITDYYADGTPEIEIDIDENRSLQDEAAERFRQYGKAKRAREEIGARMVQIDHEIAQLNGQVEEIDRIIREKDLSAFEPSASAKPFAKRSGKESKIPGARKESRLPGVRRYVSTDGYEVLVGRAARDNDNLTFKIAQPNDMWLHAGDYPGSHVVIRNPTRKEIPHRTIVEAAQLAGRFSQASEDSKVVVHYTARKFLSKPRGAAPGLVRLSRFKSITVEPKENIARL